MKNESIEKNPWKTVSTELMYESGWIKVHKHHVINPAGNPALYSTVHYKNKAIGILPLDDDYNTWIVGQYRFPIDRYSWEMPEGGGNPTIPYLESASRELIEETGIKATQFIELMRMHTTNSVADEEAIIYIAKNLSFHEATPEETEQLQLKKIPFTTMFDMVMSGEITDAMTVAAVLKTKILIDKGEL